MTITTSASTARFTAGPVRGGTMGANPSAAGTAGGFTAPDPTYGTYGADQGVSANSQSGDAYYYNAATQDLDLPPIIFCNGGGCRANVEGVQNFTHISTELCNRGYTILQPSVQWLAGNNEAVDRVQDAVDYGVGTLGLDGTRPPILMGISNGGMAVLRYTWVNDFLCCVLMSCPTSLQEARESDDNLEAIGEQMIGGLAAKVNRAYGRTAAQDSDVSALPANSDPFAYVADFNDRPGKYQTWLGFDDPFGSIEQIAFAQASYSDLHFVGATGHTTQAILQIDEVVVADFIDECVAAA